MEDNLIVNTDTNLENPVDAPITTDVTTTDCVGGVTAEPAEPAGLIAPSDNEVYQEGEPATPVTLSSFFGTIQESITIIWRYHLKTRKYSVHNILESFYTQALYKVDEIIELYQGVNSVVDEPFVNCIIGEDKSVGEYLCNLKNFINDNAAILGEESEIKSAVDDFKALIDSTIYKLTNLTEHSVKTYDEFCYENLNENCDCGDSDCEE